MATTIPLIIAALVIVGTIFFTKRQKDQFAEKLTELSATLAANTAEIDIFKDLLSRADKKVDDAERRTKRAVIESKKASQIKDHIMTNMNHEIRTPVNGISGMIGLALNTDLSTNQRNFLEMARTSTSRLLSVINDILDFSRLEAGKLELVEEVFNLYQSLDGILEPMLQQAQEKSLKLDCYIQPDVPELLSGDINRLLQIITNLVQNALTNTSKGEIRIEVSVESPPTNQVISLSFHIKDTGIGIPIEKQRHIFESFAQSERNYTRQYSGSGLGLSICSQLVSMMGGNLTLESNPNEGSCFFFNATFTLAPQISREESASVSTSSKPRNELFNELNLLLAEDEHIHRALVQALLEDYNINITIAENGHEAVQAAKTNYYDIILMDLQMPVMNGIDATMQIRDQEIDKMHTPIIALSAYAHAEDKQKCFRAGMDDYVSKPMNPNQLFSALERQLLKKVLVIDENFINQRVAVRILTQRGWKVTSATTPKQALKSNESGTYDMIIIDTMMPGIDAISYTKSIREASIQPDNTSTKYTAIYAATSGEQKDKNVEYYSAGMDGHILKPFTEERIAKILHQASRIGMNVVQDSLTDQKHSATNEMDTSIH